jgi:hypothetical protein
MLSCIFAERAANVGLGRRWPRTASYHLPVHGTVEINLIGAFAIQRAGENRFFAGQQHELCTVASNNWATALPPWLQSMFVQ